MAHGGHERRRTVAHPDRYGASHTLATDILLVVRVPVLSEQMTVVAPSVSTDGRDRTMAFFLAIFMVPVGAV